MNYLSVDKLSKHFGEKTILEDVSFGIDQGEKVALVGINGSGKSTLLKMLAGTETVDEGEIRINKRLKWSFLDQNPDFDENLSILETVLAGESELLSTVKLYHQQLEAGNNDLDDIISQMDAMNAWDFESTINQVLGKLGLDDTSLKAGELSGGMKKRIALAKALLEEPDFLILDEPTNHLDLEAIEWLQGYLKNKKTALLLVSHDRYFLDEVCNSILEIDRGKIYKHRGSYVDYLNGKEVRTADQQKESDKARNLLRKELQWLRRQPKARTSKAKYRIDAVQDLQEKASNTLKSDELDLDIMSRRMGKKILELDAIGKSFDRQVILEDFTYTFKKGEKVGIIGKNGSGKSTFLNIITSDVSPDSGVLKHGKNTVLGYYKQEEFPFDDHQKVIEAVTEVAEVIEMPKSTITASQLLNRFMFPPKKQHDYIGKLSGGEKKRLQMLRVLIKNPNFLILDEPTNDLDIVTLNILEEYLTSFNGCLLLVSHDRYFMDKLVDHLFVFRGNGVINDFPGNYSEFRNSAQYSASEEQKSSSKQKSQKPRFNEKRKLTFRETQEFESLEAILNELENKKESLTDKLNSGETDHEKLAKWALELEQVNNEIDTKELRWLELSEIAD